MRIEQKNSFEIIMRTVNTLVDLVKPTFGPSGNKVIIGNYSSKAIDDGVQVAKDLKLDDEAENHVLNIIREVAIKTNDRVGDGTTGSLILLQAIMKEIERHFPFNGREISNELKKALIEAVAQLRKKSKTIKTKNDLEKVAMVSFENEEVAKLLAETIYKIGSDGIINVEHSEGLGIECVMTDGFEISKGFISHYMVTEKEECVLDNPLVLVTDVVISNNKQILPILEKALELSRPIAIFSKGVEGEALSTLILNKLNGKLKSVAVSSTDEDIALLTGAYAFMSAKGGLANVLTTSFGQAKKIIVKRDSTTIIGGKGDKTRIKEAIETADEIRKAKLTNSIAVIKVGANTENEAKALTYKVEDASNAVKVAYRDGVVKGAGLSLMEIKTSSPILNKALKYPHNQLLENLGVDKLEVSENIIDPVAVLIAGLESAVSIACLLCTVKGIIIEKNESKER